MKMSIIFLFCFFFVTCQNRRVKILSSKHNYFADTNQTHLICHDCSNLSAYFTSHQINRIDIYDKNCKLIIEDNQIEEINVLAKNIKFPVNTVRFPALTTYNAYEYTSTEVPRFLSESESLETLLLNLSQGSAFTEFSNGKNLKHLWLIVHRIEEIPKNVFTLENLTLLKITPSKDRILQLPPDIAKLQKMEKLILPIVLDEENIKLLRFLPELEILAVKKINQESLAEIRQLDALEELYIESVEESDLNNIRELLPNTDVYQKDLLIVL